MYNTLYKGKVYYTIIRRVIIFMIKVLRIKTNIYIWVIDNYLYSIIHIVHSAEMVNLFTCHFVIMSPSPIRKIIFNVHYYHWYGPLTTSDG